LRCDYIAARPIRATSYNWSGFIQNSWSIVPNLTINAGVRYEEQRLNYPNGIQGTADPVYGGPFEGIRIRGLIARRIGIVYDWPREGRSKIFANWGRFYESIPLDVSSLLAGQSEYLASWNWRSQCGGPSNDPRDPALPSLPENCPRGPTQDLRPRGGDHLYGRTSPKYGFAPQVENFVPGLKGQYLDELVLGTEYEILPDLRLGVSYQDRRVGRIIEDASPDGGN